MLINAYKEITVSLAEFSGKTIVVTGAASGIGRRTAELLIAAGARVVAMDRNQPSQRVSRYIAIDLSRASSIDAAIAELGDEHVDGLCNIAGVPGTVEDETLWRINYLGLRRLTMQIIPKMPRGSAIVNLASIAGCMWRDRATMLWELASIEDWQEAESWIKAHPDLSDQAYRVFKEALIVWCLGNAHDWSNRLGVRMNCVSPGPVQTPIFDDFKESLGQQNVEDAIARTRRPATPDDIAPVVLFLLSDAARWIIGMDLRTDGGLASSRFSSSVQSKA
ncbi:coniferyl-alcohol dehydrogenase [Caballeronia sp. 15711]|uniref:coniferyl-alcohol dehydrogenase n=1 Tax=Caballeronia sp. 15711 TaxID=3391029 RepID=UPI0039E45975